jgi:predicted dehydrogenase
MQIGIDIDKLTYDISVVCEKPFTPTAQEADDLIAIAKKNNKQLAVFQSMFRHSV